MRAGAPSLAGTGTLLRFDADGDALDDVVRYLAGAGVRSLTSAPPTLEELFLRHYGEPAAEREHPVRAGAVRS